MAAGRQREFDKQVALDAAMNVFWLNGYTGTSLSDLTDAMGINKPSLYAAFGNKEALFVRALNHYIDKHGSPHLEALRTAQGSERALREALTAEFADRARTTRRDSFERPLRELGDRIVPLWREQVEQVRTESERAVNGPVRRKFTR